MVRINTIVLALIITFDALAAAQIIEALQHVGFIGNTITYVYT